MKLKTPAMSPASTATSASSRLRLMTFACNRHRGGLPSEAGPGLRRAAAGSEPRQEQGPRQRGAKPHALNPFLNSAMAGRELF